MTFFWQFIIYTILILGPILLGLLWYRSSQRKGKISWMQSQRHTTLHVLVPKENEKGPIAAEQMFASLHGIFKSEEKYQQQVSFEIASRGKFIHFYVHVPVELKDFVEGQIYAQYPTVEVEEGEDYSHRETDGLRVVGCELVLTKEDVYPIKTFKNFDVDPLSAITSVLSKVKEQEEVWIQVIIRPVSDRWQEKGISYITAIKNGIPKGGLLSLIFRGLSGLLLDFFGTAFGKPETTTSSDSEVKLSGPQQAALKEIEKKVTKLGFATKIRVLVMANDEYTARAKIAIVGGVFKQFSTTNLNSFETDKIQHGEEFLEKYKNRVFYDQGYILNIEELASLFHLPSATVETPNIVWAGSKKGEPPANLPMAGKVDSKDLAIFARTDFRHITSRFGIKNADRRLHIYTIGKTGTGKSTMLENMIVHDIHSGKGVAVIDPHGELIDHILEAIPASRVNDVIYFNPADRDWPIGFNLLANVDEDLKNIVASGVVGIFKKIFTSGMSGVASWGPRLEYILRNVILALLSYPDSTMLGIMRMLTDKDYRKRVLDKVNDPVIRDFFLNEFEKYDPKFRTEAISPIQNKVGQFLSSSTIRNIVGQPRDSVDVERVMNEGKIFLLDLSVGKIGEDNSALLGAMMITKIQLAAMRRASISEEKRRDFYLYVDEFQNFATESFAVILSEARKYHLCLTMTNQYIAQMPEPVAKAIFGNVGSIISFRVGVQDATVLAKEFEPVFEPNDLVNLANYHVYVKMAVDGVTRPAFSAITLPPPQEVKKEDNREKVVRSSRERYAKPRAFVEEKIQEWSDEQKESIIKTVQREKGERINKIVQRQERRLGERVYLEIVDNKGLKWYMPKLPEETVTDEKQRVSSRPAETEEVHAKTFIEDKIKKSARARHLVTLEEVENIAGRDKKHMQKDLTPLKAGESVKIKN